MSSPSAADAARARRTGIAVPPGDAIRTVAVIALMGYVAVNQLDAVANRIAEHIHVSLVQVSVVAVGAGALLVLGTGRPRPIPWFARLASALLLWAVICWTLSLHVSAGLTYLVKFATAIAPALCLTAIVDRPAHVRAVAWSVILASGVAAVIVLIEAKTHTRLVATSLAATTADFDGVARSSGGSDQNATTAAQMLMVGAVLAAGWLASGERRGRLVLIGVTAIGAVALALMSARSAVLGAGAAAALILFSYRRSRYFPLLLLLGAAALAGVILFAPPTLVARFAAIEDFGRDQTLYRRVTYLLIGLDLIQQSPVWGIGPGNFPLYFISDAYRWMPGRELIPRELHNTYLDVATELGLVGLGLFVATIAVAARGALRGVRSADPGLRRIAFAVGAALLALLVGCVFMPHKDMRYLWMLLALAERCGAVRAREEVP